jgi:hypothetical protein
MSCVVYRDRVMAATSGWIDDGIAWAKGQSLHRRNDVVYGAVGATPDILQFIDWHSAGCDRSQPPEFLNTDDEGAGFSCLVAASNPLTLELWDPSLVGIIVHPEFYAIGSGAKVAVGALHCGVSAADAVKAALIYDPECVGRVEIINL